MAQKSKHAARLRQLGFRRVPGKTQKKVRKALSLAEQQYLGLQSTFSPSDIVTYATDETGQSWFAKGRHDLTHLGFRDNEKWFAEKSDGKKPN